MSECAGMVPQKTVSSEALNSKTVNSSNFTRHAPKKWPECKSLTQHHTASAMLHGIGQVLPAEYLAPSQQSQYTGKKSKKRMMRYCHKSVNMGSP